MCTVSTISHCCRGCRASSHPALWWLHRSSGFRKQQSSSPRKLSFNWINHYATMKHLLPAHSPAPIPSILFVHFENLSCKRAVPSFACSGEERRSPPSFHPRASIPIFEHTFQLCTYVGQRSCYASSYECDDIEHVANVQSFPPSAIAYWGTGRLEEGLALQTAVVDARTRIFGQKNAGTLSAMNELGRSYWLNGQYHETLELQTTTLKLIESA